MNEIIGLYLVELLNRQAIVHQKDLSDLLCYKRGRWSIRLMPGHVLVSLGVPPQKSFRSHIQKSFCKWICSLHINHLYRLCLCHKVSEIGYYFRLSPWSLLPFGLSATSTLLTQGSWGNSSKLPESLNHPQLFTGAARSALGSSTVFSLRLSI